MSMINGPRYSLHTNMSTVIYIIGNLSAHNFFQKKITYKKSCKKKKDNLHRIPCPHGWSELI